MADGLLISKSGKLFSRVLSVVHCVRMTSDRAIDDATRRNARSEFLSLHFERHGDGDGDGDGNDDEY
tara:strand:- start:52 stop:252 length:201 start_codon:yes stop_codon:yes gene_type:complete